jgi:hypothetical protein
MEATAVLVVSLSKKQRELGVCKASPEVLHTKNYTKLWHFLPFHKVWCFFLMFDQVGAGSQKLGWLLVMT